jgi:hypothetical protein
MSKPAKKETTSIIEMPNWRSPFRVFVDLATTEFFLDPSSIQVYTKKEAPKEKVIYTQAMTAKNEIQPVRLMHEKEVAQLLEEANFYLAPCFMGNSYEERFNNYLRKLTRHFIL